MIEAHYRTTPGEWRQIMRGRCLMRHVDHEHPLALLIKDGDKQILAYAISEERSDDNCITHMGLEITGELGESILNDQVTIYRAMIDHRARLYEIDIHAGETPRRAAIRQVDRVMTKHILPSAGATYSDFDPDALRRLDDGAVQHQEGLHTGSVTLPQFEAV
jgi:hypothetical protein